MHLDQIAVGDYEHAPADLVDVCPELFFGPGETADDELGTVAPRLFRRVLYGLSQAFPVGRKCRLFRIQPQLFAAQSRPYTIQDHGKPEPSGVYDPRLLEDIEQLWGPPYGGTRLKSRHPQDLKQILLPPLHTELSRRCR